MTVFVSVVLVLLLLIVFFFFVLRGITIRLGKFAQLNVLRQSGVLDELIVSKEQELERIQARIDRLHRQAQPQNGVAAPAERFQPASYAPLQAAYKDGGFVEDYRVIRECFVPDRMDCVQKVLQEMTPAPGAKAAREILDQLSLDTLYLLSTLPSKEQEQVLEQELSPAQNALLQEYLAQAQQLESYEFYTWLRDYDFQHSAQVVVRTNSAPEKYSRLDKRVKTMSDPSICEGVCIVAQGKIHDFSIRSREISG